MTAATHLGWVDRHGRLHVSEAPRPGGEPEAVTVAQAGWPGVDGLLHPRPDPSAAYALPDGSGTLVLCDLAAPDGTTSPWCTRSLLAGVIDRAGRRGLMVIAAAEIEFFLLDPEEDRPVFENIEQYGIVAGEPYEPVLRRIRGLRSSGVPVVASNCEYGGGQFEVNLRHGHALPAADEIILLRHWAREIAEDEGYRISFDAKPWADNSGSGMHFHQSLWDGERNLFWDEPERLSPQGEAYLAGLLEAMPEMTMLGSPSGRAYLRRDDFSFCPTSACWGGDNRTVAVRVIAEREPVTRIEQRDASSDANPYLALAAQVAAGLDGLDAGLSPPAMVTGNAYGRDDLPPLPSSLTEALARFAVSDRARGLLGEEVHSKLVEFAVADCASDETSERSWF